MDLNIASLSDFTKLGNVLFMKGLDGYNSILRSSGLFRMDPIPDNTGNTREYTEIDPEEYAREKGENDSVTRERVQQGYSKIAVLKRIAHQIGISYEMRHQNKYQEVISRLTNVGRTVAKRMELDLAHIITFGTSTAYRNMDGRNVDVTVGDTKALFDTAHTVRGASSTFRNRLANSPVFSRGSLEAMELMIIENSINQFGEKITIDYDTLWTTNDPNTVNTVREYLRSTSSPDANNGGVVNVYSGKYKHLVLPLVPTTSLGAHDSTKMKYWGLASTMNSQAFLAVNEEPHLMTDPASGNNAENRDTDEFRFDARAGYFVVVPGARWVTISLGDGTA